MRVTHVEVSVARGVLADDEVADLDRLFHDVFGWTGVTAAGTHPTLGPTIARTYTLGGGGVRLVLREADVPMRGGAEDHLGIAVTPDELTRLGRMCHDLAGVETLYLDEGIPSSVDTGAGVFRTFFVRHSALALWFQLESFEPR